VQYTVPHETMKMVLFNSFALEKTFIASYIIVMVRIEVTRYIDTITLQYQSDGDAFLQTGMLYLDSILVQRKNLFIQSLL